MPPGFILHKSCESTTENKHMKHVLTVICTTLFILVGALAVVGQEARGLVIDSPADYDTTKAPNVTVGRYTITVSYPTLEVRMYPQEHKVRVTNTDRYGDTQNQVLEALVSKVTTWIWRAEIDDSTWLEINTATGATFVHAHCITRVFSHDPEAWTTTPPGQ